MKKFSKQIFIFIVPLIILGTLLELSLRRIPNDYEFKNSQIDLQKDSIKTLLIGSSHIMYGLNPDYFKEKSYNLGHVSQTIDVDYYLLEKYIKVLPKLETVVMRLSYTTLHEQLKIGTEAWRLKDYNLYYNLNVSDALKHKSEILSVKLKNNLTRLKHFYFDHEKMINLEASGWAYFQEEKSMHSIQIIGPIIAKKHTAENDNLLEENLKFLDKIVKLCDDKGIKVLLVTLPAHKSYRDYLEKHQLELVLTAGEKMENKYDHCSYLNFLNDENFIEEDFYDADHLNRNGAIKLSTLVNSILTTL